MGPRRATSDYTLVICEKPDAARRIAYALGDTVETKRAGISIFKVAAHDGKADYLVCSAVGHIYGLADVAGNRSIFPVLDLKWTPLESNPKAKRIVRVISDLAKEASSFVHACDYDQEGEVIGYSILEYACKGKYSSALRAKFSTLTDEEIRESFEHLEKTNGHLAEAGRSRHLLDFIYGVNLSRALAASYKAGSLGGYRNLSIGRVQGPTLAFVAEKELAIRLHVPDPYWTIEGEFEKIGSGMPFTARYEKARVEVLAEAKTIASDCSRASGTVDGVEAKNMVVRPPTPFNVGDLQKEAFRVLRISPGYTLAIAEKLYLQALISYPRTSSQKLPASIGYRKIITGIAQIGDFQRLTSMLIARGKLIPNEGAKTDPAHPAIYPTGIAPRRRLGGLEFKVYDLIIKRFLATFGDSATVQKTEIMIGMLSKDGRHHSFKGEGRIVTYNGWMIFYQPYVWTVEGPPLPADLKKGDSVRNRVIRMEEKFSQPSSRYSQASLLAKMEDEGIGTKATRADIIETLFKRNYVDVLRAKGGIQATDLGISVVESMRDYIPSIISPKLTKTMEEDLERVEQASAGSTEVIEGAVDRLVDSLAVFRRREREIGTEIVRAAASDAPQEAVAAVVGNCPLCKTGELKIIISRTSKKRFLGCSNYAKGCRASAPLPQRGGIRRAAHACKQCSWPVLHIYFVRRGKPWTICPNLSCPSRANRDRDLT